MARERQKAMFACFLYQRFAFVHFFFPSLSFLPSFNPTFYFLWFFVLYYHRCRSHQILRFFRIVGNVCWYMWTHFAQNCLKYTLEFIYICSWVFVRWNRWNFLVKYIFRFFSLSFFSSKNVSCSTNNPFEKEKNILNIYSMRAKGNDYKTFFYFTLGLCRSVCASYTHFPTDHFCLKTHRK